MIGDLLARFFVGFCTITCVLFFCGNAKGYSLTSNDLVNLTRSTRQNEQCNEDECKLPEQLQFGNWSFLGGTNKTQDDCVNKDGVIKFECSQGHRLVPQFQYAVCLGQNKWTMSSWPICMKKCAPLYSTATTTIKCFTSEHYEIKCDEAFNGSSATFTCAPYYEPAERIRNARFCWDGLWDLPPPICRPVCGKKRLFAQPLTLNGREVKEGNYPWVTAIYHKEPQNNYTYVCTGSILNQRVILTAAHCVTDSHNTAYPKEDILIGVGKYYKQYMHPGDTWAQYLALDQVIVNPHYKGDSQRYSSDIALLITKDVLRPSNVVQPVCYQDLPNIHLQSGLVGVVSGWGNTSAGSTSDVLLEIDVPYKRQEECYQELEKDWAEKYYTPDKMCAGHYNKSAKICIGNSGGGLVYKNNKDNRYYVHGIVSIRQNFGRPDCNMQVSALYTQVIKHFEWLEKIVSQYSSAG